MSIMPRVMFGTGFSAAKDFEGLHAVCAAAIASGITAFDTAPSYKTEEILGKALSSICSDIGMSRQQLYIQTKIDPIQMIAGRKGICEHIKRIVDEMGVDYLDGLLIHWPIPEYVDETWEAMVDLKSSGIVRAIGVSNVKCRQLKRFLAGISPDLIQIERNPLRICFEEIKLCQDNNIAVQAYSPLCKMHPDISDSSILKQISNKYCRSIGEIVLRWHIDTGVSPVFTSKNIERIKYYGSITTFRLDEEDVNSIATLNKNYKMYLESWSCPGF